MPARLGVLVPPLLPPQVGLASCKHGRGRHEPAATKRYGRRSQILRVCSMKPGSEGWFITRQRLREQAGNSLVRGSFRVPRHGLYAAPERLMIPQKATCMYIRCTLDVMDSPHCRTMLGGKRKVLFVK